MVGYVSIKEIMDNLLDHPLLQDITLERAINYALHFIKIIGTPTQFEEKTDIIEIKNYRGLLPCDFYSMIQVRTSDTCNRPQIFRYATDSFHYSPNKNEPEIDAIDLTYKIQNSIIFTSIKEGTIEIAYQAIMIDEEGYPLIPENSSFIQALELYIKKRVFTILFDQGKINQAVLQNTQQEYAWYVGQAQRELSMPTLDQMESISNMWTQLLQRNNEQAKGFKPLGRREYLRNH
nr:MAG TPA: hypothetical protein [Crassvirales sp.]